MKICFVSQNIYALFYKNGNDTIGGAELQQLYIGKGLAQKGYIVQYITQDCGQDELETIDNIQLYKSFREDQGIPVVRFLYPRLYKIWKALKKADADVYYVRSAGFILGIVAYFCRIYGKKAIYAGAHDTDFMPGKHIIRTRRDVFLYHYGLRHCDKVIVQSLLQKKLLKQNFGINGELIRNISLEPLVKIPDEQKQCILWVATLRTWKRPHYFINLAQKFPEENFIMIGGKDPHSPSLYTDIKNRCDYVNNITFLGFRPLDETETYFNKCKIFINTSEYEGFPNTFLQAWRRGTPVISFVDPDNLIKDNNLGIIVKSEKQIAEALNTMINRKEHNSDSILEYFSKNHSSHLINKYIDLIGNLF